MNITKYLATTFLPQCWTRPNIFDGYWML